MTFNDFVQKHKLKQKATSNKKIYQIPLFHVAMYLRDGQFEFDIGIVNLQPSRGTHWVCYKNKNILISMAVFHLKNYLDSL